MAGDTKRMARIVKAATSSAMRALGLLGAEATRIVSGDSIEITHTITIS